MSVARRDAPSVASQVRVWSLDGDRRAVAQRLSRGSILQDRHRLHRLMCSGNRTRLGLRRASRSMVRTVA